MKFTKTTLEHLEQIVSLANYRIRYERGVFQSDHCILFDKRVIVINKFLSLEGRISVLVDVIHQFKDKIKEAPLDTTLQKLFYACLDNERVDG